jgi:hypothetical protein
MIPQSPQKPVRRHGETVLWQIAFVKPRRGCTAPIAKRSGKTPANFGGSFGGPDMPSMRFDNNGIFLGEVLHRPQDRKVTTAPVEASFSPSAVDDRPASAAVTLPEAARILGLTVDQAEDALRAAGVARHVAFDRAGVEALREAR